jgi:hypothetical protein
MGAKLRAKLWVQAQIRLCDISSIAVTIPRKGDPDAGSVILKLDRLNGEIDLYTQSRTGDGEPAWLRAGGTGSISEAEAGDYIRRQIDFDPDLWVVEIEDPDGRYALDGPVLDA